MIPLGAVLVFLRLPIADLIQHIMSISTRISGVVNLFFLKDDLSQMEPDLVAESWVDVPEIGH